jgi:SAM-dependent methyltransferase
MFTPQFQNWIRDLWSRRKGRGWGTLEFTTAIVLYNTNKVEYFKLLDSVDYNWVKGGSALWRLNTLGWWLQDKDRLYYTLMHNPASEDCLVLNLGCGYGLILDMFYQFGYRRFIAIEINSAIAAVAASFFVEENYPGIQVKMLNTDGIEFIEHGPPILEKFVLEATAFSYASENAQDYVVERMSFIEKKYDPYLKHVYVNGYLDADIQMLVARKRRSPLIRLAKRINELLPKNWQQ